MNTAFKKAISSLRVFKSAAPRLTVFPAFNFSTSYRPQNLLQIHGRLRYDENAHFKTEDIIQESIIAEDQVRFEEFTEKIKPHIDKYYSVSVKRKEIAQDPYPEKNGDYYYFSKPTHYKQNDYEIVYRNKGTQDPKEELVLDMMQIPFLKKNQLLTCGLTKLLLSDNQDYLAFVIDPNNDENLVAGFRDLKSGLFLRDKLKDCANLVFSKQNPKLVYYVAHDMKKRTFAIKTHLVGTSQENDKTLFVEENEAFYLDIKTSKDKEYILIHSSSKACNEILVIDRNQDHLEKPEIKTLFSRTKNQRAFGNHARNNFFLVVTEEGVYDSKIVSLSDEDFKKKNFAWKNYYVPQMGEIITEIDLFKSHTVIYLEKEGVSAIKIKDDLKDNISEVDLHDAVGKIEPGINEDYITEEFVFHFSNPFIYNSAFKYNINKKQLTKVLESQLTGPAFNKDKFLFERTHAPGHDGEEIPMTIIRKKDLKKDRKNKLLLIGYGAYGQPLDVGFNIVNLAAVEDNWIIAYAHVRGGNEKGRDWHNKGKGEHKIQSFEDFLSCAEFLIAEGYTHPSLLCAFGSSAGGLLVGGAINMKPELFKAAILNVPFVDVLSSLLDKDLPLTLTDHDEFGNPIEDEKAYENISGYCPYENLRDQEYPAVLIASGTLDYRCPLWNVLKYVQRFRYRARTPEKIEEFAPKNMLLNITESGHAGEVGTSYGIREKAIYFGFLDYVLFSVNKEVKVNLKPAILA